MKNSHLVLFFLFFILKISLQGQEIKIVEKTIWEKVSCGFQFCEGPAWDNNGNLFVSDCYGKYIAKITMDSTNIFLSASNGPFTLNQTNGLAIDKEGYIYACDYGIGAILKISPEGKTKILADGFKDKKFNRPNDIVIDSQGNIFFTDPKTYNKDTLNGRVFKIEKSTNEVKMLIDGMAFPNGLAFSPDEQILFVSESAINSISRFDFVNGELKNKKNFITLPSGDPDGLQFDKYGNLIVAHFGGSAIYVISSEGNIIKKIETPGKKPSNVEFGGKNLNILYLTEDETGCVYKMNYYDN